MQLAQGQTQLIEHQYSWVSCGFTRYCFLYKINKIMHEMACLYIVMRKI